MGPRIFAGLIALLFFYIVSPLAFPIAMGGVLAVLLAPWLAIFEKKKGSTVLGSFILTFAITMVLLVPVSFLTFFAAKTGFHQLQNWRLNPSSSSTGFMDSVIHLPMIHTGMIWLTSKIPVEMSELVGVFQDLGRSVVARIAEFLGGILSHLPGMLASLGLMVVSVYFFLVDGKRLTLFFKKNSVFTSQQTDQLMKTAAEMCRSVILASLVSGGVQSVIEVLVCALTSTPHLAFIGLLVFIGSFIPIVGSAPITLTVAIHQIIEGRPESGIVLLITAMILIGVDNAVRPLFLKGSANLHPFLAFIAAFGGLQTWGFWGVFLGPIVAALFIVVIQIWLESGKVQKLSK